MSLNIVATRRYSLKGFAEGWDDCFVMVRAANEKDRELFAEVKNKMLTEIQPLMNTDDDTNLKVKMLEMEEEVDKAQRQLALDLIQSGMVVSTKEDGTTEKVNFTKEDVPVVVDALGPAWLSDIVEVATGADRLKAKMN